MMIRIIIDPSKFGPNGCIPGLPSNPTFGASREDTPEFRPGCPPVPGTASRAGCEPDLTGILRRC